MILGLTKQQIVSRCLALLALYYPGRSLGEGGVVLPHWLEVPAITLGLGYSARAEVLKVEKILYWAVFGQGSL